METYSPDHLTTLARQFGLPPIRYHDEISSTNDAALQWLSDGAPDQSVVLADRQTAGRGRLARRWVTHPGVALAFSFVLRPRADEVAQFSWLSLLAGLAVRDALAEEFSLNCQIKWPNDILAKGQKIAGILTEAAWLGDQPVGAVIGIGINIASGSVPPPQEVKFPAASLEDVLGFAPERRIVLSAVLSKLVSYRQRLMHNNLAQSIEQHLAFRERYIYVLSGTEPAYQALITGLDQDGNLLVTLPDGSSRCITAGEVSLRPVEDHG